MAVKNQLFTKTVRLCAVLMLLPLFFGAAAQAQVMRFTYAYYYKQSAEDSGYRTAQDMILDWDGDRSVFYSEATFLCDSLGMLAFDRDGNIADEEKYAELTRMPPGGYENALQIDYRQNRFCVIYDETFVRVFGRGTLALPAWELLDEERELKGYRCKKAVCDHYGRRWTAWYTEEIPVNAGPWLLWGLPGVIVGATDSGQLFQFVLHWVEEADRSRYDAVDYNYQERRVRRRYEMSYEDASRFWTRLNTDQDFQGEVTGRRGGWSVGPDGVRKDLSELRLRYIPLVPDSYWKKK